MNKFFIALFLVIFGFSFSNKTFAKTIIKNKNKMDIQTFQMAFKSYFSSGEKNIHKLMEYANVMGISGKVRQYTEVLL